MATTLATTAPALDARGADTGELRIGIPGGEVTVTIRPDGSTLRGPSMLVADGVLRPSTAQSPLALRVGREGAPTPVDVLAAPGDLLAFTAGTLAPVGQTRGTHTLTLAGLGLLGLALTVGATLFARRQGSLGGR